ncbi:phosphatase PAP2 family protein [Cellulophaga sp. HaHa_2_1]|uniref:phosphatase PAP2 family protein n=1 Tax=Cellulophaga sp. HaHa_2_1 TaxID=2749994 RepID=UPI001C4F4B5A|nr:phosphatase PAP2 family protein [Cellulophaga sp. HaHa_2_1]QXP52092.1 phosphatase PAP2 family protein [Cellulophaga sp. HaHa_2_1]
MLEELLQYDKNLFLFLNHLGTTNWDAFWLFITNKLSSIPLYLVLAFLFYKSYGLKKTLILLVVVALMITATDQVANLFKYGFKRLRPCHDEEIGHLVRLVKKSCGGQYGYFSAHASNSFAIALFLGQLLKEKFKFIGYLLLFWAFLVAYSRIYIGVHFPLDVLTGGVIGFIFSWLFIKLYIFATQKISL